MLRLGADIERYGSIPEDEARADRAVVAGFVGDARLPESRRSRF